jgi:predicted Rossmann-fold nucleotide-binding protein
MKNIFSKIISGGQTGVDRAALDAALALGLPVGGWCPKGRRAEDGPIDFRYPLKETDSFYYPVRTEKNVMNADGTLVLTWGKPKGGTALTVKLTRAHKKPYFLLDLSAGARIRTVLEWGRTHQIQTLNIAGPREGETPGIYKQAFCFLKKMFQSLEEMGYGPEKTSHYLKKRPIF